ncbi:MAG: leucine-rich repeat domain-containing protein [Lachnospiraceae bacterium]|nr:leucine-rich repeat domain-containing protein [Lachnospiraceae bacterium]
MDRRGKKHRLANGILHRVLAVGMGVVLLSGQPDLFVNAQEEAEIYTTPVETETAEDEIEPDKEEESAEEENEPDEEEEKMKEENAPDEEERYIEGETTPDEENRDIEEENMPDESRVEEEIVLEEELSSEAGILPKEEVAEKPMSEEDFFYVNMLTEPNIRLVCRVIDGANQRVAIERIVYDGEASDEIEIPATVSYYGWDYSVTEIGIKEGGRVFADDAPVKRIKVPEGVTAIRQVAFMNCKSLETLELPDSLTVINLGAFNGCSELTNITLPSHVREIGNAAFLGCSNLTEIVLPDTLTTIGPGAFERTSLEEIWIPDSVVEIGEDAFYECKNLKKVKLPSGLSSINRYVFEHCTSQKR